MNHLYDTYGTIYSKEIVCNETNIRAPIDLNQPIDAFFQRIELSQEFAKSTNDPFSELKLVNIVQNGFQPIRKYKMVIREWKKKEEEEKTYEAIKLHFMLAHDEIKERKAHE